MTSGSGLHAATHAGADAMRAREALVKYVLRPPLANNHVELTDDGMVRVILKKAFRDGTIAVEMEPLSLLARRCAAVPPPRLHTVTYAGVLAPNARLRPLVVPPQSPPAVSTAEATTQPALEPGLHIGPRDRLDRTQLNVGDSPLELASKLRID